MNRHLISVATILFAAITPWAAAEPAAARATSIDAAPSLRPSPRERISIDHDWRFQKDDPPGNTADLRYDVRPDYVEGRDDGPADARPTDVVLFEKTADSTVLKPWILPTGNAFIKDPAKRYVRPPGNPGANVAYVQRSFDDSSWRRLNLPHDWAIEGPFIATGNTGGVGRLPSWGVGWYRKKLQIPASDVGRSVFLEVDGAMSYATVWLNGRLIGGWPYGYSSWRLDLTPYVEFGAENQLAIRLDNPPASSRWYPGGGIYRHVWLVKTNAVQVTQWGTQITTRNVSSASATVDLTVTLDNRSQESAAVEVTTRLFALTETGEKTGDPVAVFPRAKTRIAANGNATVKGTVAVLQPRLWGPPPTQQPHRYLAVTSVAYRGDDIDEYETRFGIRALQFDPATGLSINGEYVRIQGVNMHHDLGALGTAFNHRAAQRQLEMLHEMGCNAVRMSHNPPTPELLDLTDAMGFLVLDEAFDVWERKKTPLDHHLFFPDWHEQDLRALVRRDRNHPSVIVWSIGNEVGEQYTAGDGAAIAQELRDTVHEEDSTRPVTSAMNFAKSDMPLPAVLDLIGLNYQGEGIRQDPEFDGTNRIRTPPQYDLYHAKFPNKVILSTETASAFSSRGIYLFPVTNRNSDIVRDGRGGDSTIHQVSSYELHAVDFGSSVDKVFGSLAHHPFVAGEFVWTGWDHLGEPTPYYTSRSAYAGSIDLAGFKKDRFFLYQSHWRPDLPMAHILPHWTWPERVGEVTPIHVFTSGDEAELFLNGRSHGRKTKGPYEYRLRWDDVVYEPGRLEVVAFKNGQMWAKDVVQTAGAADRLIIQPDRKTIRADGLDLSFVTVTIVDKNGVMVPRADNRLKFEVEGPGEIVATDNGDPTSFESFQAPERNAFGGLCLVIVRAKAGHAGLIRLVAAGQGLVTAEAAITSVDVAPSHGL